MAYSTEMQPHAPGPDHGRAARTPSAPTHSDWHLTRDLLFTLTGREIAIRYKESLMGFFWALFMPMLVVLAGLIVRIGMARLSGKPLGGHALAAIMVKSLPWALFASSIRLATSSLTANSNLVTRARCPRIVFPVSAVLSALFDFSVALLPLIVALAWVGTPLTWQLAWVAPLMLLLVAFTTGLGVALATANLFYRDVKYIVEVVLMFAIFFTPVLYEADVLGPWRHWVLLNPVAPILEGLYSTVVLGRAPELSWIGYSALAAAVASVGGWLLFRRLEPSFADRI